MSAERIAFIGHLERKPETLLEHFSEVRELSQDRPQAKILHAFMKYMDIKKQNSEANDSPCIFLMDDDQEALLKEAQKLLDDISGNGSFSQEVVNTKGFFSSLILVKPDTEDNFFQVDKATGIRIWRLRKGETAFPTHPTPAH